MKKDKDGELDNLFKRQLGDASHTDTGYLEDDWNAFETMLDGRKKRPVIVYWLPILSSAAAVLLFVGWLLLKQQAVPAHQQNQQPITGNNPVASATTTQASQQPANNAATASSRLAMNQGSGSNGGHVVPSMRLTGSDQRLGVTTMHPTENTAFGGNTALADQRLPGTPTSVLAANSYHTYETDEVRTTEITAVKSKDLVGNIYHPDAITSKDDDGKATTKLGFVKHPQFALTVVGASEYNSVASAGNAKSGTNVGLLFSAGVFNKLSITTGANYSTKPYNTDIANYHTAYTFKVDPSQIEADCRVLDIPINVDYQLYNKNRNKFSIGTGLSSYIMLHESYQYYYTDPTTKGPAGFTVPGQGKYFFGIANLQATYTRQVNSKFGLSVQPYMKLPLSNIGYSQVRLQTAGVAVGVNWNINSLTKP